MSALFAPTDNVIPLHQGIESRLTPEPDSTCIRGVRLVTAELVDQRLAEPAFRAELRERMLQASPFPHLVLEGLFNPRLLELVAEEFDLMPPETWADVKSAYESTRRSALGARLGPAAQLYFDIVNSGWFTSWLSDIVGVPYLLTDPKLFGGGLHESRPGAAFAIHRDFTRHRHVGLTNQMVFITYLNKGWQPEWGSALELWDAKRKGCVTRVEPEFGRTILMPHGSTSYHGHPTPMQTPDGRPRRSVAAYFYSSPYSESAREDERASIFLYTRTRDRLKTMTRMAVPPIIWAVARKLVRR